MADIYNDIIAARAQSGEIPVTPLAPLGFNSTKKGVEVWAKNNADDGSQWGLIYTSPANDDLRILYPTSAAIKVVGGPVAVGIGTAFWRHHLPRIGAAIRAKFGPGSGKISAQKPVENWTRAVKVGTAGS